MATQSSSGKSRKKSKPEKIGGYSPTQKIGQGAMGDIWLCHDPSLDRMVVVKQMIPNLTAYEELNLRFQREASLLAHLKHPNIVHAYSLWQERTGRLSLAMEFVHGKTLREVLDVSPIPPLFATLYFLHEILQVLSYAHQRKIIHRDLKPSNMMINKIGRIKLLDFGIARNAGATQDMTLPGSVLGTAAYMSPEQITGKKVTLHSDLFSLGIIAFEMLTGKHPFRGETMELTTQYILNVKIHKNLFPKQVPHALRRFVCKILEKKPSKRFQSAQEAADELSKIMEGFPRQLDVYMGQWLDSLSHPESKFEPPPQKKHKSYLYLAVGFITGIIVAASTSLFILN